MTDQESRMAESTDQFLLTQFSALSNHITGLFDPATQRIAAYLVFAALLLGFVGIATGSGDTTASGTAAPIAKGPLTLSALFAVMIVGLAIWERTIRLSIQTTLYLRIINNIRGHFAERDARIKAVCTEALPLSADFPKWDQPVFDPGITIIEVIQAFTLFLTILYSPELIGNYLSPICLTILALLIALVAFYILQEAKKRLMKKALRY